MRLWVFGLVSLGTAFAAGALAAENPAAPSLGERPPPAVLLELFTSQGCSSCPPADRLLSRLADSAPQSGAVVTLAFHVDYWNYIGWTDPFSSAAWSKRQRLYADRLESRGVYTPQVVVNGRWDAVGSDKSAVSTLIERARRERRVSRIDIDARFAAGGQIDVELSAAVAAPTSGGRSEDLVLWLAVVESGFETPVGRGENIHKTLHNDHVVRRLLPAFELDFEGSGRGSLRIEADPVWDPGNLAVAAFVQGRETMTVYGATSTRLAD